MKFVCFLTIALQVVCLSTAFLPPLSLSKPASQGTTDCRLSTSSNFPIRAASAANDDDSTNINGNHSDYYLSGSTDTIPTATTPEDRKNTAYVEHLLDNLTNLLDKWILTGTNATKQGAYNVLHGIELHARDPELVKRAQRKIQRAGLPLPPVSGVASEKSATSSSNTKKELGRTDDAQRKQEAERRKQWEASSESGSSSTVRAGDSVASRVHQPQTATRRSALSRRSDSGKDAVTGQVDPSLRRLFTKEEEETQDASSVPSRHQNFFAMDKKELQQLINGSPLETVQDFRKKEEAAAASNRVSELVAQANFEGAKLEIGGLDEVLDIVKRRVWTPLAAPPQLLRELGIAPVRGLLLYGRPGCGKTLLARTLGQMLSPLRPITVVSGPEIMDKYVGSSEMKLREIFDNPPDIYEDFREEEANGDAIAQAALHVVIMDEFDSIARHRGGRGGSGDQGDAGVARDSVVNQLLAKMDGVAPLEVPTLVIGLTNKRSLIDSALLRPGRFEVQLEVPPPRTVEQRKSILKVHTRLMQEAGRLLVRDAPEGSAAAQMANNDLPTYDELLERLANETDGFTGASLAAVARAAASHALERAVEDFTHGEGISLLQSCVVRIEDFEECKKDFENMDDESDYAEDPADEETGESPEASEQDNDSADDESEDS